MAGHVTELVADSWMAKPWGRSSRSTGLSTPPGLPAEAARAVWAAAGAARVSSVSSSAEQVLTWRIMPPYRVWVRSGDASRCLLGMVSALGPGHKQKAAP